jgi:hypothetical protein
MTPLAVRCTPPRRRQSIPTLTFIQIHTALLNLGHGGGARHDRSTVWFLWEDVSQLAGGPSALEDLRCPLAAGPDDTG